MTLNDQVSALIAAGQRLSEEARGDAEFAERLLANPAETIVAAAGHPLPEGVLVSATRDADGAVELWAHTAPAADGELDDAHLDAVAGGGRTITNITTTTLLTETRSTPSGSTPLTGMMGLFGAGFRSWG